MELSHLKHLALSVTLLTLVGCATASKTPESVKAPPADLAAVIGDAAPGAQVQLPDGNPLGMDAVIVDRSYVAASGRECRHLRQVNGAPIQRVACKSTDGVWRFARDLTPGASNTHYRSNNTGATDSAPSPTSDVNSITEQALVPSAGSELLINEDGSISTSDNPDGVNDYGVVIAAESDVETETAMETGSDVYVQDIDTVQREVNVNETLWKFSKRTTGNALNWQTIADINGITDAKKLAAGTLLNIPASMVK